MIIYMFQCHSPISSHLALSHRVQKTVQYICVSFTVLHTGLSLLLSRVSRVRLRATHRRQPTRLPRPWDSPGKNTGVGCHFLLQCMKVKSDSEVAQSSPTLRDPMDCSLPVSSVHGIFQARVLEWGAVAFPEGYHYHLYKFHIYALVYCIGVFISGLLHSV